MATRRPQNGHFKSLSLNKVFDPSTPSMRKGDDGGEKKKITRRTTGAQGCNFVTSFERF